MPVRLNGSTSGYAEIDAPAVAGNNTLILPGGNGTADQVLGGNGSGALSWVDRGRMTLATAQNTNSGTAIDFTGIPSWVKRVTVMFNGVSTNGASLLLLRLGSASFAVSGYNGTGMTWASSSTAGVLEPTGFPIGASSAASVVVYGSVRLETISSNTWIASGSLTRTDTAAGVSTGGCIALGGVLDRVRLTTVNGTDTFDAGSVNILMEG